MHPGGTDAVVARFYKELSELPNSKFVLTTRCREKWLESCRRKFVPVVADCGGNLSARQTQKKRLREDLYGSSVFSRRLWKAAASRHTYNVLRFFSARKRLRQRLLLLDVSADDAMTRLCDFLRIDSSPARDLRVPNIGAWNEYLAGCEYADMWRKCGLLYIQESKGWVRRKFLLVRGGVLRIYRRPETPLQEPCKEARVIGTSTRQLSVEVCIFPPYQLNLMATGTNVLALNEGDFRIIVGCSNKVQMAAWETSFSRCCDTKCSSQSPDMSIKFQTA